MTPKKLFHFLIVFNHDINRVVELREFEDATEASTAYAACEDRYDEDENIEVVLLGSDSVETLHRTHPNYFADMEMWDKFLAYLR